jgi:hypothetical protein
MGRLSVTHALALRRLVVAGGALSASLLAHCAAAGDLRLTAAAPVAWGGLLAVTTVVGARRRFRPRGIAGCLAAMVAAQAVIHVAMTYAPWAFGLAPHHHGGALIGPGALAAHAAAAVVIALLAARLEAWLARATAVMAAVRRWLAPRQAARPGIARLRPLAARTPRPLPLGAVPGRGPPALRPA